MATVLIGCKLPHGIVLKDGDGNDIRLNGMNTSLVAGGFGITHVEASTWAYISAIYEEHSAFKANAIFTHETAKVADLRALAAELSDVKTGFEGVDPTKPAPNMKPEDTVDKQLELAERQPRPSLAPASAADKAAANELAGA